ncbi:MULTISPECIES: PadR family transcriptional regulator [unclassified Streptomyces]|uniref:PadR family transcriptional regulator n=1 Tax=unclassified Streptomyces TaxID=2593676 RepID=UPI002256EE94|nr:MULTISPECIES: PadR family transcriptional regulator [unclassified Streptomyces]MCX5329628.1 PadR family transcriptional regulator [Streptomyces sp. NBC_00140]MCX5359044.1 PadR family transcriptional regulator [Streptomyces sp. NBC_00124]
MALRNAVMAALLEGEASGYDLAKGFEASVANFWMATPQQLYRELERMEAEGLVSARVVQQERRPNKRLFSLTDAGLEVLRAYIADVPAKPTAIRDELMVKVQCVDIGDADAVRTAIVERVERSTAKLARYERMRERMLAGRTEDEYFAEADRIGPYLTLLGGMAFERSNLKWGETALKRLDQRASRQPVPPEPRGR